MKKYSKPDDLSLNQKRLLHVANQAQNSAYAPYSGFHVGAAVLTAIDSKMFSGCNIETAAHTGLHAEDVAVGKAVSVGYTEFIMVAVIGGPKVGSMKEPVTLCGKCRQLINEFRLLSGENVEIIMSNKDMTEILVCSIDELLPFSFGPTCLKK